MFHPLFINWNPDPSVFGLPVRWYGLLFAAAFFFGYLMFVRFFKNEKIDTNHLDNLTIYMAIGTLLGARLGHVFFYEKPEFWLEDPLRIFKIWEGGLASHGAAIGIILSMYIYSRRVSKRSVFWLLDRIVIGVALSGLFIRSGNLVNSEIVGNYTQSSFGMIFVQKDQAPWSEGEPHQNFYVYQKGDEAEFHISRESVPLVGQSVTILEHTGESHWREVQVEPKLDVKENEYIGRAPFELTEPTVFQLLRNANLMQKAIAPADSTDTRQGQVIYESASEFTDFSGRWTDEGVALKLNPRQLTQTRYVELFRSRDKVNWENLNSIQIIPNSQPIGLVDKVEGEGPVYYRIIDGRDKLNRITLGARHPSMMYEAFAYLLIFFFLFRLYWSKKGKIREGEIFGYFLVLVFTARLLIEFTKIAQEHFDNPLPLNMGQLLSIPFILAGFYFLWRARKIGVVDYPPFPERKKKGK